MKIKYINVYLVDRAYGGPEEGGWWYDVGEFVKSIPCLPKKADRLNKKVHAWCERQNEGRKPPWSVLSEGHFESRIENKPGRDWPSETPFYE